MRAADGDFVGVVEAVALGDVARRDAAHFAFDKVLAQNGDHARKRAHPAQRFGADRGRAPALRLRPWEGAHDSRRSEEYTSELQSLMRISYAVFCLKKKK